MFRISVETERRLLLIETSGLGTVEEVADFTIKEAEVLRKKGWASGEFVTLLHTLDAIPQPQDVVQALQHHLQTAQRKPHRLAVVKAGAIAGMQTRRVLSTEHAAHFATVEEAERWLASCPPIPVSVAKIKEDSASTI